MKYFEHIIIISFIDQWEELVLETYSPDITEDHKDHHRRGSESKDAEKEFDMMTMNGGQQKAGGKHRGHMNEHKHKMHMMGMHGHN